MASKSWRYINNHWYYFHENGVMATGWIEYQGRWYYLNNSNGVMVSEEYRKIGDAWYMFNENGEMLQDKKIEIDSSGAVKIL